MASKVLEIANKCIKPIVEELGYELLDLEYVKLNNGMNLNVVLYSPNGISLNDCEKVHRAIDGPLDECDPTNGASYILNVSSPGLDRPLKKNRDFELNMGKVIEVGLFSPLNGKKQFMGELTSFNDKEFTILDNGVELKFERSKVAKIIPYIEINI